jgi:peroxiredoxin
LEKAGIINISIFPSAPAAIKKYARKEKIEDNVVLSDEKATVYKNFQVKKKTKAIFVGGAEILGNMKRYAKYIHQADINKEFADKNVGRSMHLPADFLINEEGIIVDLFRAQKPTDHMSIERIEAFIPKERRCKCNGKECLFPGCRREYEIIRKEAEKMFTY